MFRGTMANTLRRFILLVVCQVFFQGSPGTATLCNLEGSFTEQLVVTQAGIRWRTFPEYLRTVLGDLDQFGGDDGIQPYEVTE